MVSMNDTVFENIVIFVKKKKATTKPLSFYLEIVIMKGTVVPCPLPCISHCDFLDGKTFSFICCIKFTKKAENLQETMM